MVVEEQSLVEGASAMAVAAAREHPDVVGGNDVAIIISGGNVNGEILSRVLNEDVPQE
jgi:threonine dehydratase